MLGALLIILLISSFLLTDIFALSPLSLFKWLAPPNLHISLTAVLLVLLACFGE